MRTSGTHRHNRGRHGNYGGSPPGAAPMYYGWSHDESRMQLMDLPDYLDSFRVGYERALEDLQSQLANVTQAYMPGTSVPGGLAGYPTAGRRESTGGRSGERHGRRQRDHGHDHDHDDGCECRDHGHHDHDHDHDCGCRDHGHHDHDHDHDCGCRDHGHHDHGCGCGRRDDCRCDCCIVDADYVVYARCFERRIVSIQIANDTRKVRENVTVEVSDVRSSGGRTLPWKVTFSPRSTLTLEPCSTTELNLSVDIECGSTQRPEPQTATGRRTAAQRAAVAKEAEEGDSAEREGDFEPVDVDDCEVGYITIRVGGCLVRPIVVAIAVLPRDCDAYHVSCSCSCC